MISSYISFYKKHYRESALRRILLTNITNYFDEFGSKLISLQNITVGQRSQYTPTGIPRWSQTTRFPSLASCDEKFLKANNPNSLVRSPEFCSRTHQLQSINFFYRKHSRCRDMRYVKPFLLS